MDALRKLHEALEPGATLVDTQPVFPDPPVRSADGLVGRLDMREWATTVRAVNARIDEVLAAGLFEVTHLTEYVVEETFDTAEDFVETVNTWDGTNLTASLADLARQATPPITVDQDVRLRLLMRRP